MDFGANSPEKFKGGLGRWYEAPKNIRPGSGQTPNTSSIIYTRSPQIRPLVWFTTMQIRPAVWRAFSTSGGKPVTVKSSQFLFGKEILKNEANAIAKLQKWSWIPGRRVSPKLYEGITYDANENLWFIASEWLGLEDIGKGRDWIPLADILKPSGKRIETQKLSTDDLLELQISLYKTVRILHRRRVVHGDIKDEHVAVKVIDAENGIYDFRQIRLFDFGLSYLTDVSKWHGASIGFCSAYFWNPENRLLNKSSLEWLDWYCADAVLYLALTGECFPTTSPAYRDIYATGQAVDYCYELNNALSARWSDNTDRPRKALAYWLIRRLCKYSPDEAVVRAPLYDFHVEKIGYQPALWFLGIILGGFMLSHIARIPALIIFAITTIILTLLRLWQTKYFLISDWNFSRGTRQRTNLFLKQKPVIYEFILAMGWSLLGSVLLPIHLYPAIPAITGLFLSKRINMILGLLGISISALIAWMKLTINGGHVLGFAHWPTNLILGPPGFLAIISGWLISYGVVNLRFRANKKEQRFAYTGIAILLAWLAPLFIGRVLYIPFEMPNEFIISGAMSIVLGLLGCLYATWKMIINVKLDQS